MIRARAESKKITLNTANCVLSTAMIWHSTGRKMKKFAAAAGIGSISIRPSAGQSGALGDGRGDGEMLRMRTFDTKRAPPSNGINPAS
jgi:hypothetical protein